MNTFEDIEVINIELKHAGKVFEGSMKQDGGSSVYGRQKIVGCMLGLLVIFFGRIKTILNCFNSRKDLSDGKYKIDFKQLQHFTLIFRLDMKQRGRKRSCVLKMDLFDIDPNKLKFQFYSVNTNL